MYDKILVPLDGSTLAESVLPQVEELARRFGSQITLLRGSWTHVLPGFDEAEAQHRAVREAEEYVAAVERDLRERGFTRVESVVWYAEPVAAILEHAEWHQVDLIAMSGHGRGSRGRLVMGSVATKVLQATNVPVLLHRPALEEPEQPVVGYQRILVPLDGSELAELILPQVVGLAKGVGAEVILLKVVPAHVLTGATAEKERLDAVGYLEDVERHLDEQDVVVRSILRGGSPAEQIARAAGDQAADLIAMSTHARSALGRMLRGSVADAVLQATRVPMLLTRSVRTTAGSLIASEKI